MPTQFQVHLLPSLVSEEQLRGGVAVVLDILRASTTITQALASGAAAVIPTAEQETLGRILGVLPPAMREMVVDRAMAVGGGPIDLDDLKIIILMVFWSLGEEPDALILDELFIDPQDRVNH